MRPIGDMTSSNSGGSHAWAWPNPILYGGIFLLLAIIAVSLVVLACSHWRSYRKTRSNQLSTDHQSVGPKEMETRVAVIMAGDDKVTYLAKPI
ncbi:hypothetical protein LUZ60_017100 [Juncus effusus]|nr:hypothetical protein LUZ60_017100 [Juncus effusus]